MKKFLFVLLAVLMIVVGTYDIHLLRTILRQHAGITRKPTWALKDCPAECSIPYAYQNYYSAGDDEEDPIKDRHYQKGAFDEGPYVSHMVMRGNGSKGWMTGDTLTGDPSDEMMVEKTTPYKAYLGQWQVLDDAGPVLTMSPCTLGMVLDADGSCTYTVSVQGFGPMICDPVTKTGTDRYEVKCHVPQFPMELTPEPYREEHQFDPVVNIGPWAGCVPIWVPEGVDEGWNCRAWILFGGKETVKKGETLKLPPTDPAYEWSY